MAFAAQAQRAAETCRWPTVESVGQNLREARHAVNTARHAAENAVKTVRHCAEDTMDEAAVKIRRHPLRSIAGVFVAGVVAGAIVGLATGWFAGKRC